VVAARNEKIRKAAEIVATATEKNERIEREPVFMGEILTCIVIDLKGCGAGFRLRLRSCVGGLKGRANKAQV